MMFRKRAEHVKAVQWQKMGDHPKVVPIVVQRYENGAMVDTPGANIFPNHPDYVPGVEQTCGLFEDELGCRHFVRAGDWLVEEEEGQPYLYHDGYFREHFEPVILEPVYDRAPKDALGRVFAKPAQVLKTDDVATVVAKLRMQVQYLENAVDVGRDWGRRGWAMFGLVSKAFEEAKKVQ